MGAVIGILAQATNGLDPSIVPLIGNVGTIIVLVWYVVYDVRVRTPSMLAAFTGEQTASRLAFAEEQKQQRETFTAEQNETRESYRNVIESIRQTFNTEQASMRQVFSSEQAASRQEHEKHLNEMRTMLLENLTAMRVAVHDIRHTATTLMGEKVDDRNLKDAKL